MTRWNNQPAAHSVATLEAAPAPVSPSGRTRPAHARKPGRALFRLDLKRSLQLHWRLGLLIAATGLVVALLYLLAAGPAYIAQAVVSMQSPPPGAPEQGAASRWPFDANTYDSYFQQQFQNVTRTDVLANAVKSLKGWQRGDESEQQAIDRLRKSIDVARVGSGYQFTVSAHSSNAWVAAQVANAVANSSVETASHDLRAGDAPRLTMLREERDRIQNALTADRAEQEALNRQLGVASIGAGADPYDEEIAQLRTDLAKARTEHDEAAAKFAAMDAGRGSSSPVIDAEADNLAANDAGMVSMKQALNTRRAALILQMANLAPSDPQYRQDAAELAQIDATLNGMMRDLRAKAARRIELQLRSDLQRTAEVEAQLNSRLRQLVYAATGATSKLQRSSDLAADIGRLQTRYAAVDEQLHNLMLEDGVPGGAYVSSAAVPPTRPSRSGKARNALLIAMAGVFFGLVAAVVAHKADARVYIASEVEQVLGFAPMAQIPDFSEVSGLAADEYLLRFAAALEHARKEGHLKSCIFTGASPGSGVTTLVTRLRGMLEAMGRPTVLVDASGTSSPEESADSAPAFHSGSTALATTRRGSRPKAVLRQMAEESDRETLVLTDTAPLAVSAETEYLARFADCAIVVIEAGVTTRAEISEAACTLQRLHVGMVGFVVNRVGLARADAAFRNAIQAIERRHNPHGAERSGSRSGSRKEPFETTEVRIADDRIAEEPIEDEPILQAFAIVPPSEPPSHQALLPWAKSSGRMWAEGESRTLAAEQQPIPARESHVPRPLKPIVSSAPEPGEGPDSRRADTPAQDFPAQSELLWPPARVSGPVPSAVAGPLPEAQVPYAESAAAHIWPPSETDRPLGFTLRSAGGALAAPPFSPPSTEPAPEQPPANLTSRLSGLRNLLFTLGLEETTQAPRLPAVAGSPAPKADRGREAADYPRSISPEPAPVPPATARVETEQPLSVSAQPEVLPPSQSAELDEPVSPAAKNSSSRGGNAASFQGVQTLPARRGQYKK